MPQDHPGDLGYAIVTSMRRAIAEAVLFNHAVADRLGLSASEGQFLNLLELHGPLTAGQLADLTGLSTGTVTGVLDRLEASGYARRGHDPSDRRKVVVTLDAARVEREIVPLYAPQTQRLVGLLTDYDEAQLRAIADFLTRLGQDDKRHPPPA